MLELTLLLWYEDKAQGGGRGSRDKGDTSYCYLLPVQENKQTNKPTNASLVVPLSGNKPRMHSL